MSEMMSTLRDPRLRPVISACITLGFAVGVFAISFGVAAVSAGATVFQTCAMSLLVFTGASQFSAVAVIAGGGTVGSALGGALLLAARNGVFGLANSRRLRGRLPSRLVAAQLTIDESTAMAAAQDDPVAQRAAFWITGVSVYVFWNLGTLIGALAGTAINPKTFGLDAAIPSAFVAMLWPQLRTTRGRIAAALGAGICLVTIPLLPIGLPILAASLGILVGVPRSDLDGIGEPEPPTHTDFV
jgi:4-azaleucine resistance transporter AzlC